MCTGSCNANAKYRTPVVTASLTAHAVCPQAHREINIARKLADTEQEQLRCRQAEALSGDVHEFSNYLVSMWALAEEKNKRKGSRKTAM